MLHHRRKADVRITTPQERTRPASPGADEGPGPPPCRNAMSYVTPKRDHRTPFRCVQDGRAASAEAPALTRQTIHADIVDCCALAQRSQAGVRASHCSSQPFAQHSYQMYKYPPSTTWSASVMGAPHRGHARAQRVGWDCRSMPCGYVVSIVLHSPSMRLRPSLRRARKESASIFRIDPTKRFALTIGAPHAKGQ